MEKWLGNTKGEEEYIIVSYIEYPRIHSWNVVIEDIELLVGLNSGKHGVTKIPTLPQN